MRRLSRLGFLFVLFITITSVILSSVVGGTLYQPSNTAFAAEQVDDVIVTAWQTDGQVRAINAQTGAANFIGFGANGAGISVTNANNALSAIQPYLSQFGLSSAQDLQLRKTTVGQNGSTSYRYQQVYQGVPIIGGELIVNVNNAGGLSAISGEVSPNLSLPTAPGISGAEAVNQARQHIAKNSGHALSSLDVSAPELWIYDSLLISPLQRPVQLIWRVNVKSNAGYPIDYLVLVGAARGGIALAINEIDTFLGDVYTARQAESANVEIPTGNALPLLPNHNLTATTYDSNDTGSLLGGGASTQICTVTQPGEPSQLIGANSCDGGGTASRGNAAHYFALATANYYDVNYGRNSIDGSGMALLSNVDYTPNAPAVYNNAYWDGTMMVYGNGDFFSANDIVGHELSHGVTEHSSNLFYYYEAGAINESLSDVFGEFVDLSGGIDSFGNPNVAGNRWDLGEDLLSIGTIRDMENPPAFGDPDRIRSPLYFAPAGATYGGPGDQGGVHFNSGVNNKAAFLMTDGASFNGYNVTGLGIPKVSAIYYEVNTTLLTSGADYGVLYAALNQACQNLIGTVGITAADCVQVNNAALATEMNLEPAYDGYSPETTVSCPVVGNTPVILYQEDFEGGYGNMNFDDPSYWYSLTPYGLSYATSGVESLYGEDNYDIDTNASLAAPVTLTGGDQYFIHFSHAYGFEDYLCVGNNACAGTPTDFGIYDGGVVEYSIDGVTWLDAGPLFDDGKDYDGVIYTGFGNPLAGRDAFGYDSHGYVQSRYNLTTLADEDFNFRWRIVTDGSGWDLGWFIDDITIYSCGTGAVVVPTPTPDPGTPGGPGSPTVVDPAISKIGVLAPGDLGLPGEQIVWTVTISNNTGATLSNVVVSDTLRSELRVDGVTTSAGTASVSGQTVTVSIPSLGAGQSVTVQITTTVLRNPSTPFFDNTATVSGSNGFAGSASASVPAVSGLPDTGYPPAGN